MPIMRDPYLYEDVDVLKNKLGIKDAEKLEDAEAAITLSNLLDVEEFGVGEFNIFLVIFMNGLVNLEKLILKSQRRFYMV